MSIFSFLGDIFKPAAQLIDDIHTSKEELGNIEIKKAELRNKLAEIEAQVSSKILDLQSQIIDANAKIAIQEQVSGSVISKNWRPVCSIIFVGLLVAMGLGVIQYNQFLAGIAGSFLGIYTGLRSLVDKK